MQTCKTNRRRTVFTGELSKVITLLITIIHLGYHRLTDQPTIKIRTPVNLTSNRKHTASRSAD